MGTKKRLLMCVMVGVLAMSGAARGQEKAEEIKIVVPTVDKKAVTVTVPGAFWNEHLADWLDVAFCGRPSDFLHETVVSVTTTRALLEGALREIGCRDGDAWVDNVKDFPRVRGDRLMVVLEVERGGKMEKYSLDELMTFIRWGVPMGPYGFMFKGDPDHKAAAPATAAGGVSDSARILRDDPQMALVFRGIQSMSQSFADHPLAYVESRWEWEEIHRGRNRAVLPTEVYDSNGKVPVTVTFKRVGEEELITESAKVWHEEAFKGYMLKQVETARRIDQEKAEYMKLKAEPLGSDAGIAGRRDALLTLIERDYAVLDAAWASWAAEHVKPESDDPDVVKFVKQEATRWGEFTALNRERTEQLAIAAEAPGNPQVGAALAARSRALIAENKQSREYWQEQRDKLENPNADSVWARSVNLHLALVEARLKVGAAGAALGEAQQAKPADETKTAELAKALATAVTAMTLADARMLLANVEFEISKREGMPVEDAELTALKKQREELTAKIEELEAAKP